MPFTIDPIDPQTVDAQRFAGPRASLGVRVVTQGGLACTIQVTTGLDLSEIGEFDNWWIPEAVVLDDGYTETAPDRFCTHVCRRSDLLDASWCSVMHALTRHFETVYPQPHVASGSCGCPPRNASTPTPTN